MCVCLHFSGILDMVPPACLYFASTPGIVLCLCRHFTSIKAALHAVHYVPFSTSPASKVPWCLFVYNSLTLQELCSVFVSGQWLLKKCAPCLFALHHRLPQRVALMYALKKPGMPCGTCMFAFHRHLRDCALCLFAFHRTCKHCAAFVGTSQAPQTPCSLFGCNSPTPQAWCCLCVCISTAPEALCSVLPCVLSAPNTTLHDCLHFTGIYGIVPWVSRRCTGDLGHGGSCLLALHRRGRHCATYFLRFTSIFMHYVFWVLILCKQPPNTMLEVLVTCKQTSTKARGVPIEVQRNTLHDM